MTEIAEGPRVDRGGQGRLEGKRALLLKFLAPAAFAAVAAAVLLSGTISSWPTGPAPVVLAIRPVSAGVVSVRVVDTAASAADMTDQLRRAGIDVTVVSLPTNHQLVGTWVGQSYSDSVPDAVVRSIDEQTLGYTSTLELPVDPGGHLELEVGRAAADGEPLAVIGLRNMLAPGGSLECRGLAERSIADARQLLEVDGYTVKVADKPGPVRSAGPPPSSAATVTAAFVDERHPRTVLLVATPPLDPRHTGQLALGFAPSALRQPDRGLHCT